MKNMVKVLGTHSRWLCIIAFAVVVAFSMAACDANSDDATTELEGKWTASGGRTVQFSGNLFGWGIGGEQWYNGTFSISGSTITITEDDVGIITGSFQLSGDTLTLSNFTGDYSQINGAYTKSN
jgi:uncharacterized lipoprotein YehR (DUF1307 family)